MNKQNLGYRLGKWYRKFRQWQHPTILKWLYVIFILGTVFVIFFDFFAWLLITILCGIALALYSDIVWGPTQAEQQIINELKEIKELQKQKHKYNDNLMGSGTGKIKVKKAGFREGHSGFGYYNKNNWKVF